MIGAFPDLHPDELMYSGFARFAGCVGYPNLKNIMNELFGSKQVIASVPFASHLNYFVAHQPYADRFTSESLIAEHTLLPFFTPFLPPERTQQLKIDMCGTNGPGIFMRAGLMASVIPSPLYLRYCPDCAREDEVSFGEKYWHRCHQIPGISVCHVHKVWLEDSDVKIQSRKIRHKFIEADEAVQFLPVSRPIDTSLLCEVMIFIACGTNWLLQQPSLSPGLEYLHRIYKQALIDRGLANHNGRIQMTELQEAFASYYNNNILVDLRCSLKQSPDNWLARLVRKPDGSQHPLQHLLLMCFLDRSVEAFFSNPPTSPLPFGAGPWPCLNAASDHYRQHQIEQCEIIYGQCSGGKPLGIFSCTCGFVYSRMGPDKSSEDQFRISRIKAFGLTWETRLEALWKDKSVSLRSIARQLGVDPLTVKRHASRLDLPFSRSGGKSILELRKSQELHTHVPHVLSITTLEAYRAKWLTLLQVYPDKGAKSLRIEAPGVYTWLYRHDKMWLEEHMPLCVGEKKTRSLRVNWEERDMRLAEEVRNAASHLKNLPGRPIYITNSAIGREIGQIALLQQHLDKIPRVAEALKEYCESREEFALRRIRWVAMDCIQKNVCLKRWELIRKAGIARLTERPQIQKAIDVALQDLHVKILQPRITIEGSLG